MLEVTGERPFIQQLSSAGASAILLECDKPDGVFDRELVLHAEVYKFEQFNSMINDRGLKELSNRLF